MIKLLTLAHVSQALRDGVRVHTYSSELHRISWFGLLEPTQPSFKNKQTDNLHYLIPEFSRSALEALREPLETGCITIARATHSAEFPARFQLIAAMNPCPCGFWGSAQRSCRCTPDQVARYQGKLSGPLLDRIDLHVEVHSLPAEQLLASAEGERSQAVQARVAQARARALQRQGCSNQLLQGDALEQHLQLEDSAAALVRKAADRLGWSARATHRALRVARTIADLAGSPHIASAHVAEAMQYRRTLVPASP